MYRAVTEDIVVEVQPFFLPDHSEPQDNHFVWAYRVTIANGSDRAVQLRRRYWKITDGAGRVEEVEGAGVVGEEPRLMPGESYTYTSGCPLTVPSGVMQGHYTMQLDTGERFQIAIPAFSLDLPDDERTLN
ncbi:Co2+/Mg2+ efflux protein ApaG [Notoacmeibacter sp. MSK16QG-6]|uniref:Co2+/Mg2+ efflux protein ApaG n=1 Tax=Notoacmeibacter sp. MSK16QG-6 TaxID=2957982 RepID=UPI0020A1591F|nr:Co2+/Mg2+ efflux protein ApaG [Notoacmeibacter sp. MSK16QG-6]MCP1198608.1 Co2+/Mg2+ efflux protein ApaG [Notoacmeibacter sp. MSK16QG-6]